jgi:phage terminase large subunit GpA-like protein
LPGPWYVHFPPRCARRPAAFGSSSSSPSGATIAGQWKKPNNAARNEALDQLVMTHVLAHLHGLPRLDWDNPPPWAAAPSAPAIAAARPGPSWFGERRERWF